MIKRSRHFLAVGGLAAAALLGGCMVGPNYKSPAPTMPRQWAELHRQAKQNISPNARPVSDVTAAPAHLAAWWERFHDPELTSLALRALHNNLTLQVAVQQIIQAQQVRNSTAANLGPFVSGTGAYNHGRGSENLGQGGGPTIFRGNPESDQYQAGFSGTWELDFFGQVRRGIQSANAGVRAAVQNQRAVLIALLANLANDYIGLRGVQGEIAATRANVKTQAQTVKLLQAQLGGGVGTGLALADAQAQLATTQSQLPELVIREKQLIYAIDVLLAKPPDALVSQLSVARPIPAVPPVVPIGLPGALLRRRPDVREAQDNYAAATANVGVAEANLFPKFYINGNLDYAASNVDKWFNTQSITYNIGPNVSWSLLNWGQVQANINQEKALRVQAFLNYRETVLQALGDVDSAIAAYKREQTHVKILTVAVKANERAVLYSKQLYRQGLTDFLNVLQAQQSLYTSQFALVQSRLALSTDLVAIYNALGGGWELPRRRHK